MKIVFMGTPDFAEGILEAIYSCGRHEIVACATQPDRPKGRGKDPAESPVKIFAKEHDIPVFQPAKIREAGEVARLKEYEADIYVVAAFGQILSKEILDIPRYGCINVHASLLPKYRGASPIQRAIADGETVTGVTIQQMNEGIDTGDIISSVTVPIAEDETGGSLFDKLCAAGSGLIVTTLGDIEEGSATFTPQDESKVSYAGMLKKEMGRIDFNEAASVIERKIRAYTPWPGGYTSLNGRMLKIKGCSVVKGQSEEMPGTVTDVNKDSMTVACAKDLLLITRVQAEGKKEMTVHDFLLGNGVDIKTVLGG